MPIDQTPGAAPVFLGLPLITSDADTALDVNCSDVTMQALRNRLYQLDVTASCASVGSVGTETITAGFWAGATQYSRSFDCVFMLGMSLLKFKVQYSNDNGATWTTVPGSDFSSVAYTGGENFVLFLASPVTANKVRLTMYDTTDKSICVFDCALTSFQPNGRPMSSFTPRPMQNRKEILFADGTKDVTYLEWSDNSFTLYELDCEHDFITTADKKKFDALFASVDPFLIMPEPGDEAGKVLLSQLKMLTYSPKYTSQWKGNGYRIAYITEPLGYV